MNMVKRFLSLFVAVVVIGSAGQQVFAQSGHFSSATLGMGGTGVAYMDTYHANFINPANLSLNSETKPRMSLGILGGLSATAGGSLLNISAYNKHFTTGELVNTDNALNDWFGSNPASTRSLGLEFDLIPIGGSYRGETGSYSLAVRNRTMVNYTMNRGYLELFLGGLNKKRFGDPKAVNFSTEAFAFSEISVGYSRKVLELPSLFGIGENVKLYAGAAPKYIMPHAVSSLDFNSTLHVKDSEIIHNFDYTFQTAGSVTDQFKEYDQANNQPNFDGSLGDFVDPAGSDFTEVKGSGFGIDLGGTIEMDLAGPLEDFFFWAKGEKKLRVSLAVTDLGSVTYNKNAGSFSANSKYVWDGIDLDDGFNDAFKDSVTNEIYLNFTPGSKEEIVKHLPTKVHLGSYLKLGKLAVSLDFTKGMNDTGLNSKRLALAFGAEYKFLNVIPVRAGYSTGGLTSSRLTAGTGLEFRNFEFSLGAMVVPNSENRGAVYGGAWSGLLFRF